MSTDAYPGLYVGDCNTSGVYNSDYGSGDGEQISEEAQIVNGEKVVVSAIIYQNTLSGDGFQSLQNGRNSVAISINVGENLVVADNDISNVHWGIEFWGAGGGEAYHMPFDIASGNSIHNVLLGFDIAPTGPVSDDEPWFIGNSFSHNLISGGQPGSVGIEIEPSFNTSNGSVQLLMNVFDADMITGASAAIELITPIGSDDDQIGTTVFSNSYYSSDGSEMSCFEVDDSGDPINPSLVYGEAIQGFWHIVGL